MEEIDYRVQYVSVNGMEWTDGRYGPPAAVQQAMVTLPPNCVPGGNVTVGMPDGTSQTIKVPANSGPGQQVTIDMPPAELPELSEEQQWAFPTESPPHPNFVALLNNSVMSFGNNTVSGDGGKA